MPPLPPFDGLRVLIVDDSKTIRRAAETQLRKEGCEVFLAENGFEALIQLIEHQPDVVLVDLVMPRLDGFQTCTLIKSNPRFRDLPVVMLSSKDGLVDRARGQVAGACHYLTKPFTHEGLTAALEAANALRRGV